MAIFSLADGEKRCGAESAQVTASLKYEWSPLRKRLLRLSRTIFRDLIGFASAAKQRKTTTTAAANDCPWW